MFRLANQKRRRGRALTLPLHEQPPPMPASTSKFNVFRTRQQFLTPALSATQWEFKQAECKLFSLPFELRQMIWRDVIGDGLVHIIALSDGLAHVRCTQIGGGVWNTAHHECRVQGMVRLGLTISNEYPTPAEHIRATYPSLIAFMKTCRQIYSESIEFLYKENTFDFRYLEGLSQFTAGVIPHRLDCIRSMQLSYTYAGNYLHYQPSSKVDEKRLKEAVYSISQMKGLQSLRVQLHARYTPSQREDKISMLENFLCIKRLPVFKILISWDAISTASWLPRSRPFDLEDGCGEYFPRAEEEGKA